MVVNGPTAVIRVNPRGVWLGRGDIQYDGALLPEMEGSGLETDGGGTPWCVWGGGGLGTYNYIHYCRHFCSGNEQ